MQVTELTSATSNHSKVHGGRTQKRVQLRAGGADHRNAVQAWTHYGRRTQHDYG